MLIPFLLIRFGLLALLGHGAVLRAAHYPPQFIENRAAYPIYQISTAAIFLSMPFLAVKTVPAELARLRELINEKAEKFGPNRYFW